MLGAFCKFVHFKKYCGVGLGVRIMDRVSSVQFIECAVQFIECATQFINNTDS